MTPTELDRHRRTIDTGRGPMSVVDTGGDGRPVLFVHGLATSAYIWRNVIALLAGERRCVALDLPGHGATPARDGEDLSLPVFADAITACCDALGLDDVDVVANDTGGAATQIFAVRNAFRLNTLTLTNCDTENDLPPKAFLPAVMLARAGLLARLGRRQLKDPERARARLFGTTYQDVRNLPVEIVSAFLEPLFGTPEAARRFQRCVATLNARDLRAIGPDLARFEVPTLIVWGTGDVFFRPKWAYWLRDTIPGATEVVEVDDGRLFFPDERAGELDGPLRRHWAAHP